MGHIFVSYSRVDQEYVRRLAQDVRNHGFDVWMDDRIDFGDRWWRTVVKAIKESSAIIVVMTPDAENSEWVEREILLAQREKKPILPILLRGDEFALLITAQRTDVRHGGMPGEDFYERLREVLQGTLPVGMSQEFRAPKPPPQTQAQQPPSQHQIPPEAMPAQPQRVMPSGSAAKSNNSLLYLVLGLGGIGMVAIILLVVVLSSLGDDSNGGSNGESSTAEENAERFIEALGSGNITSANTYVCSQNRGVLAEFIYNSLLNGGWQLGFNAAMTNPSCSWSGEHMSCNYNFVSGGVATSATDTFVMDGDLVCDILTQ